MESHMLAAERRSRIVEVVQTEDYVRSEDLAAELRVSMETIRRDLAALERGGKLMRVRGGASQQVSISSEEAAYAERARLATEEKSGMARAAASLVESGMTVMIDVGTSCLSVAQALPERFRGRVVTCSIPAAIELANREGVEVLVAGGRVRPGDLALSNGQAGEFFRDLYPDIAFLGSGGLDAAAGLTDYYTDEISTRRLVLRNAARSYVLADSSKHGRVAPFKVCSLPDLSGLITDRISDPTLETALQRVGVKVLASGRR